MSDKESKSSKPAAESSSSSSSSSSNTMEDDKQHQFRELFDVEIPKNQQLAREGKLEEALEALLSCEKQARNAEDLEATREVSLVIVRLCFEAKAWEIAIRNLVILAKRKAQLKEVVKSVVQEGMKYVEVLVQQKHPMRNELIESLRKITEGKIYVENQRARLTKTLADILEAEGKIAEASKLLQSVQVETYGAMERREKLDFLLEQTRLCLDSGDFIRAKIISNKISHKALADAAVQDMKIRYHKLMIRYYTHKKNFLQICLAFLAMYDIPSMQDQDHAAQRAGFLQMVCLYVCLARHSPEQHDLLIRVHSFKALQDLPAFKRFLHYLVTPELIRWSKFHSIYEEPLGALSAFEDTDEGKELWDELRKRVIEHNIRVISKYYTRISEQRLSELLELDMAESEEHLSRMVIAKDVYARINRPDGIISWRKPQQPADTLNQWGDDLSQLLRLLERTSHLIHRENMVFKTQHGLTQSQNI